MVRTGGTLMSVRMNCYVMNCVMSIDFDNFHFINLQGIRGRYLSLKKSNVDRRLLVSFVGLINVSDFTPRSLMFVIIYLGTPAYLSHESYPEENQDN